MNQSIIFTNAGGPAALLSDSLDANGLKLAVISETLQMQLKRISMRQPQTMNPIDMFGGRRKGIRDRTADRPRMQRAGSLLPVLVHKQALVNPLAVAESICQKRQTAKRTTFVLSWSASRAQRKPNSFTQPSHPVFRLSGNEGAVLGAMRRYRNIDRKEKSPHRKRDGTGSSEAEKFFNANQPKKQLG
jgi:acetyltransferase